MGVFTPFEVADILKVKYRTVLTLISTGKIQAIKIGKLYRITEESLKKYLNGEDESNGNNSK
jgi:excisionase family DNA binding protein